MSGEAARYVVLGVGGFQLLANAVLLVRGLSVIPREIVVEKASLRIDDLLRHSWIISVLANLCVSGMLLLLAGGVREGDRAALEAVGVIGSYYILLGITAYAFGKRRHAGVLVFCALGALLALAVFSR